MIRVLKGAQSTGGHDTLIFGEGNGRLDSWRSDWGGHHPLSGREGLELIRGSSTGLPFMPSAALPSY